MGGACSIHGSEVVHTGFWYGRLRNETTWKAEKRTGGIILKLIFRKWDGCMNCIELVQYMNRCRAIVDMVIDLRVA
jgi:hypothetical protein